MAVATHNTNAPIKMEVRRPKPSDTYGVMGSAAKDPKVCRARDKNSYAMNLILTCIELSKVSPVPAGLLKYCNHCGRASNECTIFPS